MKKIPLVVVMLACSVFGADPEDIVPPTKTTNTTEAQQTEPEREVELVLRWRRTVGNDWELVSAQGTTITTIKVLRNSAEVRRTVTTAQADMLPDIVAKALEAPATNQNWTPGFTWTANTLETRVGLQRAPTGIVRAVRTQNP